MRLVERPDHVDLRIDGEVGGCSRRGRDGGQPERIGDLHRERTDADDPALRGRQSVGGSSPASWRERSQVQQCAARAGHRIAQTQHRAAPAGQVRRPHLDPRVAAGVNLRRDDLTCDLEAEPRGAHRDERHDHEGGERRADDVQLEDAEDSGAHHEHSGRAEGGPPGTGDHRVKPCACEACGLTQFVLMAPARCRARRRRPPPRRIPGAAPRG